MLSMQIVEREVYLAHFAPRQETHGAENKLAGDLKIVWETDADSCVFFDSDLRSMLFKADLEEAGKETPRFPKAAPLKWSDEMSGATVKVHQGLFGEIVLGDAKVNKFVIEAKPAGKLIVTMRLQVHPVGDQPGRLCELMKSKISLTIIPGEAPEMTKAKE